MSLNPFIWLRRKAAEALVEGVADGLRAVTPEGEQPPSDLAELRALAARSIDAKALPASAEEEEDEPKRKARGR